MLTARRWTSQQSLYGALGGLFAFVASLVPARVQAQADKATLRPNEDRVVNVAQDTPAARTHWSLKPVVCPPVPCPTAERKDAGRRNPIDALVGARLTGLKLVPSPEADRRTLIRRLLSGILA